MAEMLEVTGTHRCLVSVHIPCCTALRLKLGKWTCTHHGDRRFLV